MMEDSYRPFNEKDSDGFEADFFENHVASVERLNKAANTGIKTDKADLKSMKSALRKEGVKFRERGGALYFEVVSELDGTPVTVSYISSGTLKFYTYTLLYPTYLNTDVKDVLFLEEQINHHLDKISKVMRFKMVHDWGIEFFSKEGKIMMTVVVKSNKQKRPFELPLLGLLTVIQSDIELMCDSYLIDEEDQM